MNNPPEDLAQDFEDTALPLLADLFRVGVRLTGDSASAEDVVQETMLEAWKSFERFEMGTNCRAWLFKIMLRCLSRRRRKASPLELLDGGKHLDQIPQSAPPAPERLTDEEVLEALDRIPAEFREAILLADVEEFSYKEIASIVGVPVGTVMSRLYRARRMLREHLSDLAEAYGFPRARAGEGS